MYTPYIPGIGKQMLATGILNPAGTTPIVTAAEQAYTRLGLWDGSNGMFWQYDAYPSGGPNTGTVSVNIMRNGVITAANSVTQASFNLNTLTALTVSSPTTVTTTVEAINWADEQLFYIDYEWLGAGVVRFGVMVQSVLVLAHVFTNFNGLSLGPYIPLPNAPCRYEATVTAGTADVTAVSLIEGCCTVQMNTIVEAPFRTNTPLGWTSGVRAWQQPEGVLVCIRGQQSASPKYTDGVRANVSITHISLFLNTTDSVLLRVYRFFYRAGVAYGTLTLSGGAAFANPYSGLAGSTTAIPACLVEVIENNAAQTNITFNASTAQVLAVTTSSSSQQVSVGVGVISLNVSLANTNTVGAYAAVPHVIVVTGQNIGAGTYTGCLLLEWSQET